MADRLAALEEIGPEVRYARPSHLPLEHELGHRRPRLLDRRVRVGMVELEQVQPLDTEPPQARLALAPDRVRRELRPDPVRRLPRVRALREDEDLFAETPR